MSTIRSLADNVSSISSNVQSQIDLKAPLASPALTSPVTIDGNNTSPFTGFKNYIINGGFDVWQRGTSFSSTGYTADRFLGVSNGGATFSKYDLNYSELNTVGISSAMKCVLPTTTSFNLVEHRIEDVTKLAGKKVTLSFWAKASTNRKIYLLFIQNFGSGGSAEVDNSSQAPIDITTTWSRYSYTYTFPSIVGKTIGASSYSRVDLWFQADPSGGFQNITTSSGDVYFTGVQLEQGSVATPFEQRPYGLEEMLCKRYYQSFYVKKFSCVLYTPNGDTRMNEFILPVPMRVIPSVTPASFNNHSINFGFGAEVVNAPTVQWNVSVGTPYSFDFGQNVAYSGYPNTVTTVGAHCDTTFYFNAEL